MSMKSLARNATMLNIILLICALFFAFYVFLPTLDVTAKYVLPPVKKRVTEKVETGAENKIPSIAEYSKISEENLFHPERKIPVEKKSEQQQPLQRPEFILYGTLITDNLKLAYIEDTKAPKTSPGRGKRQTALKKGDTMSGYTVKEIDPDQVIMARGDDTIVLKVLGNAKKERSVQTTPQAAQPPRATPPPPPAKPRNIPQRRAAPFVPK